MKDCVYEMLISKVVNFIIEETISIINGYIPGFKAVLEFCGLDEWLEDKAEDGVMWIFDEVISSGQSRRRRRRLSILSDVKSLYNQAKDELAY